MATKKERQKEKKKKNREKRVEEKIVKRREALRQERKVMGVQKIQEEEAQSLIHGKLKPIVNNYERTEETKANKGKNAMSQLENNLKILQALEEEYDRENAMRANINQTLESEGHLTMAEKMEALHQKALELAKLKEEVSNLENLDQTENL